MKKKVLIKDRSHHKNYIDVDFIEIGTSDFDTLIESASANTVGFSIEPIKYYLNNLPDKPDVTKINKAIVGSDYKKNIVTVYYIPSKIIEEKKLPIWLKGCNSINDYHILHELSLRHLVKTIDVECQTIGSFLKEYSIRSIKYLKIDTEGNDIFILRDLYNYLLTKDQKYYPLKIKFETNEWYNRDDIENIKSLYSELNYRFLYSDNSNTEIILNE